MTEIQTNKQKIDKKTVFLPVWSESYLNDSFSTTTKSDVCVCVPFAFPPLHSSTSPPVDYIQTIRRESHFNFGLFVEQVKLLHIIY